jgi:hypothetical protein
VSELFNGFRARLVALGQFGDFTNISGRESFSLPQCAVPSATTHKEEVLKSMVNVYRCGLQNRYLKQKLLFLSNIIDDFFN